MGVLTYEEYELPNMISDRNVGMATRSSGLIFCIFRDWSESWVLQTYIIPTLNNISIKACFQHLFPFSIQNLPVQLWLIRQILRVSASKLTWKSGPYREIFGAKFRHDNWACRPETRTTATQFKLHSDDILSDEESICFGMNWPLLTAKLKHRHP